MTSFHRRQNGYNSSLKVVSNILEIVWTGFCLGQFLSYGLETYTMCSVIKFFKKQQNGNSCKVLFSTPICVKFLQTVYAPETEQCFPMVKGT